MEVEGPGLRVLSVSRETSRLILASETVRRPIPYSKRAADATPRSAAPFTSSMLRVCTFNIHGGTDQARRPSLPIIADTLAAAGADIALLQECDRFLPRSGFRDQARWLATHTGYPVCHFYGRLGAGPVSFGNAVLARGRVISARHRVPLAGGGEPRGAAAVRFTGGLIVYSVHLGLGEQWRADQLAALARHVAGQDGPVLVGGDFNARIDAPEVSAFLSETGLAPLGDDSPTFPADAPEYRIDFLFGRGLVSTRAGTTADPRSSDHCLVWADVEPA